MCPSSPRISCAVAGDNSVSRWLRSRAIPEGLLLDRGIPPDLDSIQPRSGDGLDWMAVTGSRLIPRKATLEALILPANYGSSACHAAGRGSRSRSGKKTPPFGPYAAPGRRGACIPLVGGGSSRPQLRDASASFAKLRSPSGSSTRAPTADARSCVGTPTGTGDPSRLRSSPSFTTQRALSWHRHSGHDDAGVAEAIVPAQG